MNKVDNWYKELLLKVSGGYKLPPVNRQDVGTTQIDSANFEHDLREGFPLLTTKKLSFKNIAVELLWFLRGDTNIKYLVDNGCNIWNSDAYKYFKRSFPLVKYTQEEYIHSIKTKARGFDDFAFGDLGPVYGQQWRDSSGSRTRRVKGIDQIANLISGINEVVKTGVNNRRLIVNAWNVGELEDMALPPCHYGFQVMLEPIPFKERLKSWNVGTGILIAGVTDSELDKEGVPKYYLNLKWNQRSVDTFLGLPYNIASYALLAHILGKITNTVPKMLYGNLSNVHIYDTHMDAVREQLDRRGKENYPLPTLVMDMEFIREGTIDNLKPEWFGVKDYKSNGSIKAEIVT